MAGEIEHANPGVPMIQTTKVAHRTVKVRDLDVFYREAGRKTRRRYCSCTASRSVRRCSAT